MRPTLIAILLGGALALPTPALAFPAIDDQGKLFSADAVVTETAAIENVYDQYRKGLRIRTYARVPPLKQWTARFKDMDEPARERFFASWARTEAHKGLTNGVFILVCRQPLNVQVVVRMSGPAKPFTHEDGEKLEQELTSLLKEGRNDDALYYAVSDVQEKLFAHYGDAIVNPPFNWGGLGVVLLGVFAGWLALYLTFPEGTLGSVITASVIPAGLEGSLVAGLRAVGHGLALERAASADDVGPDEPMPGTS